MVVGVLQRRLLAVEDVTAAEARQDGRHRRLADVAALAGAVPGDQLGEAGDAQHLHDLVEFGAGVREVLAESGVDAHPAGRQLLGHDGAQQFDATAAPGTGLGALLDLGDAPAALLADRRPDGGLADVVTGADHRVVRQAHRLARAEPGGQHQLFGRCLQRTAADRERAQQTVRLGVADQDAAEQRAVPPDHQLLVHAGPAVAVEHFKRALGRAVRVAEAGHVHAQQLELGGGVGADELARLAGQRAGGRLGHRVAGGDQAVDPSVGGERALADGPDGRVGGAALLVHHDPAPLPDGQAAVAGQLVARAHPGGEDHQVGGQLPAVRERHGPDPAVGGGLDPLGARTGVHRHAQLLDLAAEQRAAALVHLEGHQTRCELHHMGLQAQGLECARRLQPEQSAADHRADPGAFGTGPDRLQVLDGPVDVATCGVVAGHGRDEGVGAGGEHQCVVAHGVARAGGDGLRGAVDGDGRVAEPQLDAVLRREPRWAEREFLGGGAGEPGGEVDPVVGGPGFLGEHGDPQSGRARLLDQGLQEALADHAVPDQDHVPRAAGRAPAGAGPAGCRHHRAPRVVAAIR